MPKGIYKDLERAILSMPQKEKDRYLLRLISRNQLLLEQLEFRLLENEQDLADRRAALKDEMAGKSKMWANNATSAFHFLRKYNSMISWHVRVTKDKYGEVELNIFLLKIAMGELSRFFKGGAKSARLRKYIVKKCAGLIDSLKKLDEDFHLDFLGDLNSLIREIHWHETKIEAGALKLPQELG